MYNDKLVESLQSLASLIQDSEERPGQIGMALAVDSSILDNEHLVVEAGTGTGKTLDVHCTVTTFFVKSNEFHCTVDICGSTVTIFIVL